MIERIFSTGCVHHRLPLLAIDASLRRLAINLCERAKSNSFSGTLSLVVKSTADAGLHRILPRLLPYPAPIADLLLVDSSFVHRIHGILGSLVFLVHQSGRPEIFSKLLELQLQVIMAELQARCSAQLRTVTVLHASLFHFTASSHLFIIFAIYKAISILTQI